MLRKALLKLIKELVSINSVSGNEGKILRFIENRLRRADVKFKRIHVSPGRWDLLVIKEGKKPGILFCGHCDTVLIEKIGFKVKNGSIIGPGSSDMKSALAVMIDNITHTGNNVSNGLLITVGEEEGGFDGIRKAVLNKSVSKKFKFAILGEPTNLSIEEEQFGLAGINLEVKGLQRHTCEFDKDIHPSHVLINVLSSLVTEFEKMGEGSLFAVNVLNSGFKENIIPDKAVARIDIRVNPEDSLKDIENFLNKRLNKTCVKWKKRKWIEPIRKDKKNKVVKELEMLTGKKSNGVFKAFSEMHFLNKAGIKTVCFGPGVLSQAHKKDESIPSKNIEIFDVIIRKMMEGKNDIKT